MDSQYYRKERRRGSVINWLKKVSRNKRIRYIFIVTLPVIAFMTLSEKGILTHVKLQSQRDQLQLKVQQAREEQQRLQAISKSLDDDPKMIEKVAREQLGMIREGETVYKVRKEK